MSEIAQAFTAQGHQQLDIVVADQRESTLMRVPMMEPARGTRELVEDLFDSSPDAATLIERLGGSDD